MYSSFKTYIYCICLFLKWSPVYSHWRYVGHFTDPHHQIFLFKWPAKAKQAQKTKTLARQLKFSIFYSIPTYSRENYLGFSLQTINKRLLFKKKSWTVNHVRSLNCELNIYKCSLESLAFTPHTIILTE